MVIIWVFCLVKPRFSQDFVDLATPCSRSTWYSIGRGGFSSSSVLIKATCKHIQLRYERSIHKVMALSLPCQTPDRNSFYVNFVELNTYSIYSEYAKLKTNKFGACDCITFSIYKMIIKQTYTQQQIIFLFSFFSKVSTNYENWYCWW